MIQFADICYVAGLCYILAPPWPRAETSLVPRQGTLMLLYIYPLKIPDTCKGFILPRSKLRSVFRQEWSYLRGGLTTVDRDYGWINGIHHDIGTHVIHHLFPQIPHYHLVEAVLHLHCSKKYFSDCKLIKCRLVHYERILIV